MELMGGHQTNQERDGRVTGTNLEGPAVSVSIHVKTYNTAAQIFTVYNVINSARQQDVYIYFVYLNYFLYATYEMK